MAEIELPLTPKEVACLMGVSVRTLERWRKAGYGPAYGQHRGRVWYRRTDIEVFLDSVFAPRHMSAYGDEKAHLTP